MKTPDVNLLLYAYDETSPHHDGAARWLEQRLRGTEPTGFAWSTLTSFVRVSTHRRIFANPLSPAKAFSVVEEWLAVPAVTILHPTNRHFAIFRELIEPLGTAGNLVPDAHLAALAIEHGGEVCSADNDFARFPAVRWSNPLA
ncbi:MAG: type II toxin-antitoxin system VapC family toxin [Thermomicrobiales bacterium]|nr:type II toxin-antitoxin system VapC family toxin [Thermomicrobiales bacterium]